MTSKQDVTPSCGCIFCDIHLPLEKHDGMKGHWVGKNKERFEPCPMPLIEIERAFDRFFGL